MSERLETREANEAIDFNDELKSPRKTGGYVSKVWRFPMISPRPYL